jgi:acyl-homoserine lactone acylase PvdQ
LPDPSPESLSQGIGVGEGSRRLAELFGEDLLETDIFLRTMGFPRVVEKEYEMLDPKARRYMDAPGQR